MTATGRAIMEVDPGSIAGTAVRFLDEPLARGLNGETAVNRFLDEPSDRDPAGETAVDRSLDTGVGLKVLCLRIVCVVGCLLACHHHHHDRHHFAATGPYDSPELLSLHTSCGHRPIVACTTSNHEDDAHRRHHHHCP